MISCLTRFEKIRRRLQLAHGITLDPLKRCVGHTWWVSNRSATMTENKIKNKESAGCTTDPSARELLCRVRSDKIPHFPSDLPKSVSQLHTGHGTRLRVLTFVSSLNPLFAFSSVLSSFFTHSIYFHLPCSLHSPQSPLTGTAAVDDMYPAESSYTGSMDRGTERRDSPATHVCLCIWSVSTTYVRVYACLLAYCESNRTHRCNSNVNITVREDTVCATVR